VKNKIEEEFKKGTRDTGTTVLEALRKKKKKEKGRRGFKGSVEKGIRVIGYFSCRSGAAKMR